MVVNEVLKDTEMKMKKAIEVMLNEFKRVRTGRATPAMLDGVRVPYYGTPTPINQLANISTPEPKLLVVKPYDTQVLGDIEKAILAANIGITPSNDGKFIRLAVQPLTEERRKQLVVGVKEKTEAAHVAARNIRRDANKEIDRLEKEKLLSEDEAHAAKDKIQDITKKTEKEIEDQLVAKTNEVMTI